MEALARLVTHEVLGQHARFERFAAEMLFMIATGNKIDPDRSERFSAQVNEVYRNPFEPVKYEPRTAAEIKAHISERIREALTWI